MAAEQGAACRRRFGFWPTHRWRTVIRDGDAFTYQECVACLARRLLSRPGGRYFLTQYPWLEGGNFDADFRRTYGL